MTNNGIGLGKITYGYDFNFFQKVTVTNSAFNNIADIFIPFSTQGFMLVNEDASSVVQVSFNGQSIHDELNPTVIRGFTYDNRVVSKIWFQLESGGSAIVSVRAWAGR
jgi:hypothetical protein